MKYIVLMLFTIIMLSLPNIAFSQSAVNSTAGDKEVKLGSPILQRYLIKEYI